MQQQCSLSVEDHPGATALSKIYEFSPSGRITANNMMLVLPLLPSHAYDYENLTLMYRKDATSPFVSADSLEEHKPTWAFVEDKCYVFTNHFCGFLVETIKDANGKGKRLTLESLLFSKYQSNMLELKVTFGCYNNKSKCSTTAVIEVIWHMQNSQYKTILCVCRPK